MGTLIVLENLPVADLSQSSPRDVIDGIDIETGMSIAEQRIDPTGVPTPGGCIVLTLVAVEALARHFFGWVIVALALEQVVAHT